eukprot:Lithocolla_globosa_v1_NODE_3739_length_1594_cov_45.957115.p3 type:complete len:109 gc:universal NODE_3739_length_1594_cov_45.957115:1240-1566(+)
MLGQHCRRVLHEAVDHTLLAPPTPSKQRQGSGFAHREHISQSTTLAQTPTIEVLYFQNREIDFVWFLFVFRRRNFCKTKRFSIVFILYFYISVFFYKIIIIKVFFHFC